MKVSLFYEHQLPRPWTGSSERQLFHDAMEQIELADKLGFHTAWEVEHHFLEEYSHSSAPEVFLAAVSQRTRNIRLGHGIVQTAPGYNHPARTAERIATLDIVSDGRVEFGTGESGSEAELAGFAIDPMVKRDQWLEGLQVAVRCMTESPFTGVDGRFVKIPPRNVVPKPLQSPHPPLWVACSRRETILEAARHGIGALTFAFVDPEEARHWVDDYYRTLAEEGAALGEAVNANIAFVTTFMCAPTEERAIEGGLEGANFFGYSLGHYYVFGDHRPGTTDVWSEFQERRDKHGYAVNPQALREQRLGAKIAAGETSGLRGAIGTPDQIRSFLRRYEEMGVDQIIFVSQCGRNRHEDIMESLELFGREVLPEFIERDGKAETDKQRRLERVVETVMSRKNPRKSEPEPMPDGYSFPAIPRRFADNLNSAPMKEALDQVAESSALGLEGAATP